MFKIGVKLINKYVYKLTGNDNVKLTFPMAAATSVLAWGYDTWKDVYVTSGLDEMFKETIKWPLDYFLKSWDPGTQTLYVQVNEIV